MLRLTMSRTRHPSVSRTTPQPDPCLHCRQNPSFVRLSPHLPFEPLLILINSSFSPEVSGEAKGRPLLLPQVGPHILMHSQYRLTIFSCILLNPEFAGSPVLK